MFGFDYGRAKLDLPVFVKEEQPLKAPRPLYVPDEIIVKFKDGVNENAIRELELNQGLKEKYISPFAGFRVLKLAKGRSVLETVAVFANNPLVEFAEPNYIAYASFVPNDNIYCLQWHLDNSLEWNSGTETCQTGSNPFGGIHMENAWDISTGSSGVIVAVVDTGVAYENHSAPAHCHVDTYKAFSGSSWWCGLNESSWINEPGYGNGWRDYLQHSFDLTSATGTVTFSYQYRHDLEFTQGSAFDKAFTEISTDGGDNWTILRTYTKDSKVNGSVGWKSDSLSLTSFAGNNVLIRFRVFTDDTVSDEDGFLNSDGAFFVDEITLTDSSGTLFFDDVESGAGSWEATQYIQAPDLVNTSFWVNTGETPGNNIDDDANGFIDDVNGWDFINSDGHANDDRGHGTHVAGTIAQSTNNNLGVAGVAFGATIMPIKVLGSDGSGSFAQVADGIDYAVANGAHVISMSLGASVGSTVIENAVANAFNSGVTVVAACGNAGSSDCDFPGAYNSYVIAVGATQYNEAKTSYSSFGPSLDIMAPGGNTGVDQNSDGFADGVLQNTFSDTPVDFAYWFFQGTSMATPHISGVAALLLAKDASLTPSQIRTAIESTADDLGTVGRDDTFGWGLVNAKAALDSIAAVSISLTTAGAMDFGILPLNSTQDTTVSGINDVQTVIINIGPVNLDAKSTVFSDGANTWLFGATNGADQVKWEFSPDGTTWTTFLAADTLSGLANNVAQGATQDLYLRVTMPTGTSSSNQFGSTVTIMATTP